MLTFTEYHLLFVGVQERRALATPVPLFIGLFQVRNVLLE